MSETKLLTVKEVAPILRLSRASIYVLCSTKRLLSNRVGVGRGKIVITPEAIEDYLARGTVRSKEGFRMACQQV